MLQGWGIAFITFGLFWTLAGFLTYRSDIQLGIAVTGINMFGIGILMLGINNKFDDVLLKLYSENDNK